MPKEKDFMSQLKTEFGELSDKYLVTDFSPGAVKVIPTGSASLDASLGVGGIPSARISVIYGPESTGKTVLALSVAKEALKLGKKVLYIDVENLIDSEYASEIVGAEYCGKEFQIIQPNTAEDSFKIAELGIESKEFSLIIFDSVGSLAPQKEKEDDFTDANVALVPRLLSKFLRRNAYSIRTNDIAFLFINQVRDTIGSYVKSYSMPGGNTLRHFACIIIAMMKGQEIKQGDEVIGVNAKYVVKKNKLAPPFRSFYLPIIFSKGVDTERDLIGFAKTMGIIRLSGPYYKYNDVNLGKGMAETLSMLETHPEIFTKIREECIGAVSKYSEEKSEEEEEILEADE